MEKETHHKTDRTEKGKVLLMKLNRLFSFILALMMLCLPLVACDSKAPAAPADTTPGTTGTPDTEAPGDTPSVEFPWVYRPTYNEIPEASDELIDSLWVDTQTRIDVIMNSTSDIQPAEGGKTYYVSSLNGNDKNDGLSPETAWKTLDRVTVKQKKTIVAGDVVAFERGSVFWTISGDPFCGKSGVTYTAYGEGEKPIFTSAMGDVADPSYWKQFEGNPNVWVTTKYVTEHFIGNIVFNKGESMGTSVFFEYIEEDPNGAVCNLGTGLPYNGPEDLSFDGEFQYRLEGASEKPFFYLYSSEGNPGDVYDSIIFCRTVSIFNCSNTEDVLIDNLAILWGAEHGIIANDSKNFTVQNCEIAFIGGGMRNNEKYDGTQYRRWDTRLGNGIEVYGSVDGYFIKNNYAHHILDEAFTTQYDGSKPMLDVHYTDNVVVYAGVAASMWGAGEVDVIEFSRNHVWYSGLGPVAGSRGCIGEEGGAVNLRFREFKDQVDFSMQDNVIAFACAYIVRMSTGYENFKFGGNIYISDDTTYMSVDTHTVYYWDDGAYNAMKTAVHDETAEMYVVRTENYFSDRTQDTMSVPSDVKAGDEVQFGAYEQDNNAENGAEAIDWMVLEVKDGKALLLSKYVLDVSYFYPDEASFYWYNCSVRQFLEGNFADRAFTDEEKAKMNLTNVKILPNDYYFDDIPTDGGMDSCIFILSIDELVSYLGEDGLKAAATEYAKNREGFGINLPVLGDGASYWVRNYGCCFKAVGTITIEGEYDPYGAFWWSSCSRGIRPAMWVTVG